MHTRFLVLADTHERIGVSLLLVSRLYGRGLDSLLSPYALSKASVVALLHIGRVPDGLAQMTLKGLLGVRGPTATDTIDRLTKVGLVLSQFKQSDRRCRLLTLTEEGRKLTSVVDAAVRTFRAEVFDGVSAKDIEAALRVLAQLGNNLKDRV